MSLKRSEAIKFESDAERTVYDFLKAYCNEVFSLKEIGKVLVNGGLLSQKANYEERVLTIKPVLARLINKEKVRRYFYRSKEYFGIGTK